MPFKVFLFAISCTSLRVCKKIYYDCTTIRGSTACCALLAGYLLGFPDGRHRNAHYSHVHRTCERALAPSRVRTLCREKENTRKCPSVYKLVDHQGFEPWTPWLRVRCSASWAKNPCIFSTQVLLYCTFCENAIHFLKKSRILEHILKNFHIYTLLTSFYEWMQIYRLDKFFQKPL